jgi:hypothetical protein
MNMMRPRGIEWVQAIACECLGLVLFFSPRPLNMLTNAQDFAAKMRRMTHQRSLKNT